MLETLKVFLLPTEPVYSYIKNLKLQLKDVIGDYFYCNYEPHISLLYLKLDSAHCPGFVTCVERGIDTAQSFDVTLNGIMAPGRGLIFVDVEKSLPLRTLTNSMHQQVKEYLSKEGPKHEDFEKYLKHHITIGHYLKGEKYEKAKEFVECQTLPESFTASRIVVYKENPANRSNLLVREFDI